MRVKFFKLNYPQSLYDRSGEPFEIEVDTDSIEVAYEAAVDAGGDPFRKMMYIR